MLTGVLLKACLHCNRIEPRLIVHCLEQASINVDRIMKCFAAFCVSTVTGLWWPRRGDDVSAPPYFHTTHMSTTAPPYFQYFYTAHTIPLPHYTNHTFILHICVCLQARGTKVAYGKCRHYLYNQNKLLVGQ